MKFGPLPGKEIPKERLQEVVEQEYVLAKEIFDKLPDADQHEVVVKCISHENKEVAQIRESVDYLVVVFHDDTITIGSKKEFQFQISREKKSKTSRELVLPKNHEQQPQEQADH